MSSRTDINAASLQELLELDDGLLNEVRELQGEKHSLVYNHNHELINASETISRMSTRTESIEENLAKLSESFNHMIELTDIVTENQSRVKRLPENPASHWVPALLALPVVLKSMLDNNEDAVSYFEQWRPVLSETRVNGCKDIQRTCEVLLETKSEEKQL